MRDRRESYLPPHPDPLPQGGEGIRGEDIWFTDLRVMLNPSKEEGINGKKIFSRTNNYILITGEVVGAFSGFAHGQEDVKGGALPHFAGHSDLPAQFFDNAVGNG